MGSTRKGLGESRAACSGRLQGAWTAQLTDRRPVRLDGLRMPPAGLMHGAAARHSTSSGSAAQDVNGLVTLPVHCNPHAEGQHICSVKGVPSPGWLQLACLWHGWVAVTFCLLLA